MLRNSVFFTEFRIFTEFCMFPEFRTKFRKNAEISQNTEFRIPYSVKKISAGIFFDGIMDTLPWTL